MRKRSESVALPPGVEAFLENVKRRCSGFTYRSRRYVCAWFSRYCARSGVRLTLASTGELERYILAYPHWSVSTRRVHAYTLRELYRFLGREPNPAANLMGGRWPVALVRLPARSRIRETLAGLAGAGGLVARRNRLLVELAYGSGLRLGELLRLSIEDIDTSGATAYVLGKGGRTRVVPLTTAAIQALAGYLAARGGVSRGPLFTAAASGRRASYVTLGAAFGRQIGIRAHLWRHACASGMLANGCSVRYIQELLGHASLSTTWRYTHINPQELGAVVRRYHPCSAEQAHAVQHHHNSLQSDYRACADGCERSGASYAS
jgi:integrase/recombinase XerC